MRGVAWLVVATSLAGCTTPSFDYRATVVFAESAGTVRLNHQPIAPGAVWAASYSSFADALRDPSIVEIGGRSLTIGPDACAAACAGCDFDQASLAFVIDGDAMTVTGTCSDGDHQVAID